MREGVLADDGLIILDREAGNAADHRRRAGEISCVDAGLVRQRIAAHLHCHHDLFQRGVSGALTQTVDGALDLAHAIGNTGEGVRHGKAQIIVAVRRPDHLVRVRNVFDQTADEVAILVWMRIADRVGHVDCGRAGGNRGVDTFAEEVKLGARGILGAPLDIIDKVAGLGDRAPHRFEHRVRPHFQLVLHVHGARGDEGVDARARCLADGFAAAVDVGGGGAGEAADHRTGRLGGDGADGGEVSI